MRIRKRRQSSWHELDAVAGFVARLIWAAIAIVGMSVLTATVAKADLVMGSTFDLSGGGTSTIANANGLGVDLVSSFSGSVTGATVVSTDYAGFGIGGDATRFGWTTTATSGIIHDNDFAYVINVPNGTIDARIGFVKLIGSGFDFLSIETDGTWSTVGTQWTETSPGLIEFTPGASGGFFSGDPGNGFTSELTGASMITFRRGPTFVQFPGTQSQEFDLNLLAATSSVPEPSGGLFESIFFAACLFGTWRRKRCL